MKDAIEKEIHRLLLEAGPMTAMELINEIGDVPTVLANLLDEGMVCGITPINHNDPVRFWLTSERDRTADEQAIADELWDLAQEQRYAIAKLK